MKKCTLCKTIKIEFGSWCSSCRKEYLKQYKIKNREHLNKITKIWIINNKEHYDNVKYNYFASLKGRIQNMIKSARKRAKKKNIDFNLDINWLTKQFENQKNKCALTAIDFVIPKKRGIKNPYAPSLDRIDPNKGYTKDNVRIVLYIVNCCLHNFDENTFKYIVYNYLHKEIDFTLKKQIDNWQPKTKRAIKDKKYQETLNGIVSRMFSQIKKKKLPSDIDKDFLLQLFQKSNKCTLTGIEFDFKCYQNKKDNPFRPSLDRIDCSRGYTQDNVRLVCVAVNFALNEFGESIFKQICEAYLANKISKF